MDAAKVREGVTAIAESWAADRAARQQRRALDPADFTALRDAGFTLTGIAADAGGIWRDIRSCQQTVTVQMYFAKPGAVADTMSKVLRECASKHVRVLLLLDGFGAQSLSKEWRRALT